MTWEESPISKSEHLKIQTNKQWNNNAKKPKIWHLIVCEGKQERDWGWGALRREGDHYYKAEKSKRNKKENQIPSKRGEDTLPKVQIKDHPLTASFVSLSFFLSHFSNLILN